LITLIGFTGLSATGGKMPETYDNIVIAPRCSAKTNLLSLSGYGLHEQTKVNKVTK
jgi:hypothetical protein